MDAGCFGRGKAGRPAFLLPGPPAFLHPSHLLNVLDHAAASTYLDYLSCTGGHKIRQARGHGQRKAGGFGRGKTGSWRALKNGKLFFSGALKLSFFPALQLSFIFLVVYSMPLMVHLPSKSCITRPQTATRS
jgi:hypothetical protein